MRAITVRLPDPLMADIEAEARRRRISKSDVVRERLQRTRSDGHATQLDDIADLIGSVDGLPPDLSSHVKPNLRATGYGRRRRR
jgi:Arc/MetJ-type ribon-helix-helix transcriptional regulator